MMRNQTLWLLLLVSLFVSGCRGSSKPLPDPGITIVKFRNTNYINNLLVYEEKGKEYFSLTRGNLCEHSYWQHHPENDRDGSVLGATEEVNFTESYRNPFWSLTDGWYLIDWAWGNLSGDSPYPYIENVILTDVTYDNYYSIGPHRFDKSLQHIILTPENMYRKKFIKLRDLIALAPLEDGHPTFELHYYNALDSEVVFSQSDQYLFHVGLGSGDLVIASNASDCLCNHADQMDAYWAVLQNQLTTLINNGYIK